MHIVTQKRKTAWLKKNTPAVSTPTLFVTTAVKRSRLSAPEPRQKAVRKRGKKDSLFKIKKYGP